MIATQKPLLAMTAADLMSGNLIIIPKEMSLPAAARLLSQHQVSGAPVIDNDGVCIGVLSATDFVHWAEGGRRTSRFATSVGSGGRAMMHPPLDEICQPWQVVELADLPEDVVADYMTREPVTVAPGKRITDLARIMIDAHIHRVIVVDSSGRPQGLVASTDILAAVAYADDPYTRSSIN